MKIGHQASSCKPRKIIFAIRIKMLRNFLGKENNHKLILCKFKGLHLFFVAKLLYENIYSLEKNIRKPYTFFFLILLFKQYGYFHILTKVCNLIN